MMTAKVALGKVCKNGKSLLRIRVYKHGHSPRYISLEKYILASQLKSNRKGKVYVKGTNSDEAINLIIKEALHKIETFGLKKSIANQTYTIDELISHIKGEQSECFFQFADKYLPPLKTKKYGTWKRLRANVKAFKSYLKVKTINFHEINAKQLVQYAKYLKKEYKNADSTIKSKIKGLQIIWRKASDIHNCKNDPFSSALKKLKLKAKGKLRVPLTGSEVQNIKDLDLKPWSLIWHIRNFFIIQLNTGLAVSDLITLEWSMIMDGYIFKNRRKSNEELGIWLNKYVAGVIEIYKNDGIYEGKCVGNKYVLGMLDEEKIDDKLAIKIIELTSLINKYIKKIAKFTGIEREISSHFARHTAGVNVAKHGGTIAAQKFLGHASSKTTEEYYLRGMPQSFVDDAVKKAFKNE